MDVEVLFGLSILLSFCAFGIVTKLYILPQLRVIRREDAIFALVVPHSFRFVGLSFLVPGVSACMDMVAITASEWKRDKPPAPPLLRKEVA